jgi:hypothetical protein
MEIDNECQSFSYDDTVDALANYVVVQCGIRKLNPDSVTRTYLPGIAAAFELRNCKNKIRHAVNNRELKLLAKGFQRQYDKYKPKSGRTKIAFGIDMAKRAKTLMNEQNCFGHHNQRSAQMLRQRVYTCMAVGIFFMLRCSEHIKLSRSEKLPLSRRHIIFFDESEKVISYNNIGRKKAQSVSINVEFSKTDASGFGRRLTHTRQESYHESCVVCLLEQWFILTRDIYGATDDLGVYEVPGFGSLELHVLHDIMSKTVAVYDIPTAKATSHSLRYGGATMMAAAGFPQYLIAHYGGWTEGSKSLRIYAKPSKEMLERVSSTVVQMADKEPSMMFIRDSLILKHAEKRIV